MNYERKLKYSNYILKKPVEGYLLMKEGVLEEDMSWTVPAGTLVSVYETPYNWVVERSTNFLPGYKGNVTFKAVLPKSLGI